MNMNNDNIFTELIQHKALVTIKHILETFKFLELFS